MFKWFKKDADYKKLLAEKKALEKQVLELQHTIFEMNHPSYRSLMLDFSDIALAGFDSYTQRYITEKLVLYWFKSVSDGAVSTAISTKKHSISVKADLIHGHKAKIVTVEFLKGFTLEQVSEILKNKKTEILKARKKNKL